MSVKHIMIYCVFSMPQSTIFYEPRERMLQTALLICTMPFFAIPHHHCCDDDDDDDAIIVHCAL